MDAGFYIMSWNLSRFKIGVVHQVELSCANLCLLKFSPAIHNPFSSFLLVWYILPLLIPISVMSSIPERAESPFNCTTHSLKFLTTWNNSMDPGHSHFTLRSNSSTYVVTANVALVERLQPASDTVFDFLPGHSIRIRTTWWDIPYIIGRFVLFTARDKLENCSKVFIPKNYFYVTEMRCFDVLVPLTQYLHQPYHMSIWADTFLIACAFFGMDQTL